MPTYKVLLGQISEKIDLTKTNVIGLLSSILKILKEAEVLHTKLNEYERKNMDLYRVNEGLSDQARYLEETLAKIEARFELENTPLLEKLEALSAQNA